MKNCTVFSLRKEGAGTCPGLSAYREGEKSLSIAERRKKERAPAVGLIGKRREGRKKKGKSVWASEHKLRRMWKRGRIFFCGKGEKGERNEQRRISEGRGKAGEKSRLPQDREKTKELLSALYIEKFCEKKGKKKKACLLRQ